MELEAQDRNPIGPGTKPGQILDEDSTAAWQDRDDSLPLGDFEHQNNPAELPQGSLDCDMQTHEAIPSLPCIDPTKAQVRIEYHPSSGKPPRIVPLYSYHVSQSPKPPSKPSPTSDPAPWAPFSCEADFDFAEFVETKLRLSDAEINQLLYRMRNKWVDESKVSVTFKHARDLRKATEQLRAYGTHGKVSTCHHICGIAPYSHICSLRGILSSALT